MMVKANFRRSKFITSLANICKSAGAETWLFPKKMKSVSSVRFMASRLTFSIQSFRRKTKSIKLASLQSFHDGLLSKSFRRKNYLENRKDWNKCKSSITTNPPITHQKLANHILLPKKSKMINRSPVQPTYRLNQEELPKKFFFFQPAISCRNHQVLI
jgi:hypothetical protein